MATKHVFDDADGLVERSLRGSAALNPALRVYLPHKVIFDATASKNKVAVIAGGGSGHEPGQTGYVGKGMLSACIVGDIFASPTPSQICTATDLINYDKGLVMIVNNYTGDCLNFAVAAEKIRLANSTSGRSDIKVELVYVTDDVSLGRKRSTLVGRRGLAGDAITCKVLGAAAEKELDVERIAEIGRKLNDNIVSIGASLDHCHVPGRSKDFEDRGALSEDALELGMGIHNEPGSQYFEKKPEPKDLIDSMIKLLLDPNDEERAFVPINENDKVVLFINNLGGLSNLETNAIVDLSLEILESKWNIIPCRVYSAPYMTSLNAPGFGISLINQDRFQKATGQDLLELLDFPTDANSWLGVKTGWPKTESRRRHDEENLVSQQLEDMHKNQLGVSAKKPSSVFKDKGPFISNSTLAKNCMIYACDSLIKNEPTVTKYDTVMGDGDCGITLAQTSEAIKKAIGNNEISFETSASIILGLMNILENVMGGTSGALYTIFFQGMLTDLLKKSSNIEATQSIWAEATCSGLANMQRYSKARRGDRTLIDSLEPFSQALQSGRPLPEAAEAARVGAEKTQTMPPRLGRASYVNVNVDDMPPDPGAWGIWLLIDGLTKAFSE